MFEVMLNKDKKRIDKEGYINIYSAETSGFGAESFTPYKAVYLSKINRPGGIPDRSKIATFYVTKNKDVMKFERLVLTPDLDDKAIKFEFAKRVIKAILDYAKNRNIKIVKIEGTYIHLADILTEQGFKLKKVYSIPNTFIGKKIIT